MCIVRIPERLHSLMNIGIFILVSIDVFATIECFTLVDYKTVRIAQNVSIIASVHAFWQDLFKQCY